MQLESSELFNQTFSFKPHFSPFLLQWFRKTTYTIQESLSLQRHLRSEPFFLKLYLCNDAGKKKKKVSCFQQKTLSIFYGMHILFITLLNFFVTLFMLYVIYHYNFLSLISPIFSLQICSLVCSCTFYFLYFSFSLGVCFRVNIMRVHIFFTFKI